METKGRIYISGMMTCQYPGVWSIKDGRVVLKVRPIELVRGLDLRKPDPDSPIFKRYVELANDTNRKRVSRRWCDGFIAFVDKSRWVELPNSLDPMAVVKEANTISGNCYPAYNINFTVNPETAGWDDISETESDCCC